MTWNKRNIVVEKIEINNWPKTVRKIVDLATFFWDLSQSEKFLRLSYLYDKTMGLLMKNLLFWENLWSNHNLPLISLMDLNICLVLRWPWLLSRIKLKFQKMKAVAFIAKKLAKNINKRTVNIVHNWALIFFKIQMLWDSIIHEKFKRNFSLNAFRISCFL